MAENQLNSPIFSNNLLNTGSHSFLKTTIDPQKQPDFQEKLENIDKSYNQMFFITRGGKRHSTIDNAQKLQLKSQPKQNRYEPQSVSSSKKVTSKQPKVLSQQKRYASVDKNLAKSKLKSSEYYAKRHERRFSFFKAKNKELDKLNKYNDMNDSSQIQNENLGRSEILNINSPTDLDCVLSTFHNSGENFSTNKTMRENCKTPQDFSQHDFAEALTIEQRKKLHQSLQRLNICKTKSFTRKMSQVQEGKNQRSTNHFQYQKASIQNSGTLQTNGNRQTHVISHLKNHKTGNLKVQDILSSDFLNQRNSITPVSI